MNISIPACCLTPRPSSKASRDLIPKQQWGKLYAKHAADIILRGSPKERAQTNQVLINSWQMTPNEARLLEDRDSIEGGDFLSGPANGAIYDPVTGEFFIPGQKVPDADDPDDADEESDESDPNEAGADAAGDGDGNTEPPFKHPVPPKPVKPPAKKAVPAKPSKAKARLEAIASSLADRVIRKEQKSTPDARFVAEVLNIDLATATLYVDSRKDLTAEEARAALIALAVDGDE
jgi:hypothetical protein